MQNHERVIKIDNMLHELYLTSKKIEKNKNARYQGLAIALDIVDQIMLGILPKNKNFSKELNRNAVKTGFLPPTLPADIFTNLKQATWFEKHFQADSARFALQHFKTTEIPLESYFYWFSDKQTKQKISATTQLTSNWEDADMLRTEKYNVGIDFFLTKNIDKITMVVSNNQNFRVLELSKNLSNTQKLILQNKLFNIFDTDSLNWKQEDIHEHLWESLKVSEVNNKFYKGISEHFDKLYNYLVESNQFISSNEAKQFSNRLLGRLLFIWFLRKMNLINEDFGYFTGYSEDSSNYYQEKLKTLFFSTLNKPFEQREHIDYITPYLNGGLFDAQPSDKKFNTLKFPDNYFKTLFEHFDKFNFTVDESSSDYQLIAVDPEMLGRVFESLLSNKIDDDEDERKKTGTFYTPRNIVDLMCRESLKRYLYDGLHNENLNKGVDKLIDTSDADFMKMKIHSMTDFWGVNTQKTTKKIIKLLDKIKVIDPAVGSGAFPIGMLQVISKTYERLSNANEFDAYTTKMKIIENNIYGVDIEPMATEIARLRAWLSIIVEEQDNEEIHALPNLDFKFISANSLVRLDESFTFLDDHKFEEKLLKIQSRYFNARTPKSKKASQKEYNKLIDLGQLSLDSVQGTRISQLKTFNPFQTNSQAMFFDKQIMFGMSEGFDIVIGNPPYRPFQKMDEADRKIYVDLKYYDSFVQSGDIYTLFFEWAIFNLKENGQVSFITSNKWLRANYGKKIRNYLLENTSPNFLIDLGEGMFESATVDTSILMATKEKYESSTIGLKIEDNKDLADNLKRNTVRVSFTKDEPWLILNPIEQGIKNKIDKYGIPLKDWEIDIQYGIKTGLNEAFIIDYETKKRLISEDPKSAEIIRPILRGRDIKIDEVNFSHLYLINTHNGYVDSQGKRVDPIDIENYPTVKTHLDKFLEKLEKRKDYGNTIYNLRSLSYMEDFNKQKIVWPDISEVSNFAIANENYLILNNAYMMVDTPDYFIHLLNSDVANWYIRKTAISLGNTPRFTKQYMSMLPLLQLSLDQSEKLQSLVNKESTNCFIGDLYRLSSEEKNYIKHNKPHSNF